MSLVELLVDLPAAADVPIVASAPERTWIWSDLHLSDRSVLLGWDRPFRSVEEMNRHLLRNWRRRGGADDTIICLGDVAHPDAWRDESPTSRTSRFRGLVCAGLNAVFAQHHKPRNRPLIRVLTDVYASSTSLSYFAIRAALDHLLGRDRGRLPASLGTSCANASNEATQGRARHGRLRLGRRGEGQGPITAHYVNQGARPDPGAPRCQRAPGIVTSPLPRVDRPLDVPPSPSFDPATPPPPVWFPHSPGRPISGWRPFSLSCRASPPPMVLRRRREAQSLRKGHQWDQS